MDPIHKKSFRINQCDHDLFFLFSEIWSYNPNDVYGKDIFVLNVYLSFASFLNKSLVYEYLRKL